MSVQEKINQILWNCRIVTFPEEIERPLDIDYVIIKDITLDNRNFYLIDKQIEEDKARREGVPTEGELIEAARTVGYWGKIEEEIEEKADEHIAFLEAEYDLKKKFKSRQNIIKTQIEDAKAKRDWVKKKKQEFKINSCEYLAHEIASFKLLRKIVYHPNGQLLFDTEEKFISYKQNYFFWLYYILNQAFEDIIWDVSTIREIARSVEWRLVWVLSRENLASLFNRPIGDLTLNQKFLIYWSRVYDSAFESHEPPDNETIQDDDLFDQWLANKDSDKKSNNLTKNITGDQVEVGQVLDGEYIEHCTCGAKQKNKNMYLGEKIPHDSSCLYGTWKRYSLEERELKARSIYGKNSKGVREIINREQETVLKKGLVQEQDLRDKQSRQKLGMKTKTIPVKRK